MMKGTVVLYASVLLCSVCISSVSQVLLKKAAMCQYKSRIHEYLNFTVILAYILFFISTLLTVISYRGIPLSMGAVLESTSYLYVTCMGMKIFGETVNKRKIVGLLIILTGVAIYAYYG